MNKLIALLGAIGLALALVAFGCTKAEAVLVDHIIEDYRENGFKARKDYQYATITGKVGRVVDHYEEGAVKLVMWPQNGMGQHSAFGCITTLNSPIDPLFAELERGDEVSISGEFDEYRWTSLPSSGHQEIFVLFYKNCTLGESI